MLAPTAAMAGLTSVNSCYCWTHGTCVVAASVHNSDGHWRQWTVAVVGHMAHVRLLLVPKAVMGTLTSVDRCYCRTCGTRMIAASAHSNDENSDISEPLLLLDMWHTHGCFKHPQQWRAVSHQWTVATVRHVAYAWLLLALTVATGTNISELLLLPPAVATGLLTSDDHCYCWAHGMRTVATSPTVATGILTFVAHHH
jgi:hypothetical protein